MHHNKIKYFLLAAAVFCRFAVIAQTTDIVKLTPVTSPIEKENFGRIVFMSDTIPLAQTRQSDVLKEFVLQPQNNLSMRAFLGNSLTNIQHQMNPALTVAQLNEGNFQFAFYVDDQLIYKENLHKGAGYAYFKNSRTVLTIKLISNLHEDMWSRYLFSRFMMRGGEDAFTTGTHKLRVELRPYISIPEVKVGEIIASGEIKVIMPAVSAARAGIQAIKPNSGWQVSAAPYNRKLITEMNTSIAQNKLKDISSIVVIKNGKLLIEEYFNGEGRDTLHDPRSVGKTFAGAVMGIAIKDGFIKSEQQTLGEFYNLRNYQNYSPKKDSVTLKSLLTMSSVFDANDNDDDSPGNENNMYPTPNWVNFALDLKIDSNKKAYGAWNYFTAGIVVLGDILNQKVPGGLEKYADAKLFKPLGITKYQWPFTPQHVAGTAGGLKLRALDFAKFGQLYKNNGIWNGRQIIPESWVQQSFTKHMALPADVVGPGFYGYLFWNKTYSVGGKAYETWYCTGNGGNKIFIFKDQPLVIVITAKAYNEAYAHPQADKIMQNYILPAVVN